MIDGRWKANKIKRGYKNIILKRNANSVQILFQIVFCCEADLFYFVRSWIIKDFIKISPQRIERNLIAVVIDSYQKATVIPYTFGHFIH